MLGSNAKATEKIKYISIAKFSPRREKTIALVS